MCSSAAIFDLFRSEMRGRALGTFQGLEFIGSFIGAPIGSSMVQYIGFNGVFLIASALILCSFLVAFLSKGLKKLDARNTKQGSVSFKAILPGKKRWELTTIYLNSFIRMFIMQGITATVLPLYLNFGLGIEIELIGLIVSARTIGIIIAAVTSGYLSDMFGRRKTVILGIATQSICYCFYLVLTSFESLLGLGVLEGLGNGIVLTALMLLLSDRVSPKLRGGAIGMYRTFMDVGGLVGPIFFTFIFYRLEPYLTFVSAILILCLNAFIAIVTKDSFILEDEIRGSRYRR